MEVWRARKPVAPPVIVTPWDLTQHSITIPGSTNSSGRLLQVDVASEAAISASTAGGGGHGQRLRAERLRRECRVVGGTEGRRTIASSTQRACRGCRSARRSTRRSLSQCSPSADPAAPPPGPCCTQSSTRRTRTCAPQARKARQVRAGRSEVGTAEKGGPYLTGSSSSARIISFEASSSRS